MAAYPTFADWNAVTSTLGFDTSQWLQQQGVPLNQVGSYINQNAPSFAWNSLNGPSPGYQSGGSDPAYIAGTAQGSLGQQGVQGSLLNALQLAALQGGGQQQPQVNWDPTQSPNYQTSLLGAQALRAVGLNPSNTVTINPTPNQTPASSQFQQSGVSAVANPQTVSIKNVPMPTPSVPSVFGPVSTPPFGQVPPTQGLSTQPNYPLTGAWSTRQRAGTADRPFDRPFAIPPPPAQTSPPGIPPAAPTGPISSLSASATPPGPAILPAGIQNYVNNPTTPGTSAGSIALQNAGVPQKKASGGPITGQRDTDTVPAMLTPGEYVINRNAAQKLGPQRLAQLNQGVLHLQGGGEVPFFAGASAMPPGYTGANAGSDAQSWAFGQLNPQEQATLQGGGTAAQGIQQKLNQLVNQYQQGGTAMYGMGMGSTPQKLPATASQTPVRSAPTAQQQTYAQGSLAQWLQQYGHTPQGQAYLAQNANVPEVQQYLSNLTGGAPQNPSWGAAPRAELVGLPAGQGPAYDPKTYGINTGPGPAARGIAGAAGAIGQLGQNMISGAENALSRIQPAHNAIPSPDYFKRNTPDVVLHGHQVGQPDVPGGYVLLAQPPTDQNQGYNQGYLANNFG